MEVKQIASLAVIAADIQESFPELSSCFVDLTKEEDDCIYIDMEYEATGDEKNDDDCSDNIIDTINEILEKYPYLILHEKGCHRHKYSYAMLKEKNVFVDLNPVNMCNTVVGYNSQVFPCGSETFSLGSLWETPTRIAVIEKSDCIEFIYKEVIMVTLTIHPAPPPEERVFKIVFSCKDGKWHKSDRIYGKIIPKQEESYEFD